jgi:hypothetical protein
MNRLFRWAAATAGTLAITLAVAPSAQAQVTVAGTSSGDFTHTGSKPAPEGLTFEGLNWSAFLSAPGDSKQVTFGTLELDRELGKQQFNKNDDFFSLVLSFTQPVNDPNRVFQATLHGTINSPENGNLTVAFGTVAPFWVGNAQFGLVFSSPIEFDKNDTSKPVIGTLTLISGPSGNPPSTVTPEPISMALLGTGLAGVAAVRRRRKSDA